MSHSIIIELSGSLESDLKWEKELSLAAKYLAEGIPFTWYLNLGLQNPLDLAANMRHLSSYQVAAEQFGAQVYPSFSAPICLYRGEPSFKRGGEELEERFAASGLSLWSVYAMDAFGDFLQRVASFLPIESPLFVEIRGRLASSLALAAQIVSPARFGHIGVICPDLPFTLRGVDASEGQSPLALCLPSDSLLTGEVLEEIDLFLKVAEERGSRGVDRSRVAPPPSLAGDRSASRLASLAHDTGKKKDRGIRCGWRRGALSKGCVGEKRKIGVEGFEPPTYCSQSSRASQAALYSDFAQNLTSLPPYFARNSLFCLILGPYLG